MTVRIINADCRDALRELPAESVHCVVTSPPYWGLRDYGVAGQIGLEASVSEHITILRDVFREVRRVLRPDGTLWVNYGDAYCSAKGASGGVDEKQPARRGWDRPQDHAMRGFKPKDLIGLPWRLAFALQDDGWWLRSDVIWSKPNPMPESVTDRPTRAHEYVFLLSKSARYFYDADAIRVEAKYPDGPNAPDKIKSPHGQGYTRRADKQGTLETPERRRGYARRNVGFNERWDAMERAEQLAGGANARTVWEIATQPFPEAHFATFPTELARRCILAGCAQGGTVLDPFGGAGTVGLVADRLQRDAILIELNPEYAAMARRRVAGDCPMFAEVA